VTSLSAGSGDLAPGRKKPIAGILAVLCDLAAWFWYPMFWDVDPYVAVGALVLSVLFAATGAIVALLGLLGSAVRARNHPSPSRRLVRVGLAVSIVSIGVFIATFDWIVRSDCPTCAGFG
jgi:hypothetical protein